VRTLVHDPSLILMDIALAPSTPAFLQVRMDLEHWLRRRPTVLFITHSVRKKPWVCPTIFVMSPAG
jgi:NitT/TauT family transport system ATP-binding protein